MRMPPSNHVGSSGSGPTTQRRYAGSDSFRNRLRNNSGTGSTTTTSSSSSPTTRLQQKLENAGINEFVGRDENYVSSSESGSSGGSGSASSATSTMNTTAMPNKAPSKVVDADNNMGGVDSFVTALKKRQNSRSPVRDRVGGGDSNNAHHLRRGWQHVSPTKKGNNSGVNNGQLLTKEDVSEEKEEEEGENEENQTTNTAAMSKNHNSSNNHGGGRHRRRGSRNLRIDSNDAGSSSSRPNKHHDSEAGGVLSPRKNAPMATGVLSPRNKKKSMMMSGSSAPLRSPHNTKKANENDALLSPRQNKKERTVHMNRHSTAVAMSTVVSPPKMKARSNFNNIDAKSANKASSTTVVENGVASPRQQKAYLLAQRRLHRGSSAIFKNPGKQPKSSVVDAVLEKDKVRAENGGASPPPIALNDTHRLGSLDKPIDIVGSPGASSLWKPKKAPQSSSAGATARMNGKSAATVNGASARAEIPLGRSSRRMNGIKHVVRTFPKKETNIEEKKENQDCTTTTATKKEETPSKDDRPLSKLKDGDTPKEGDAKKDTDKDGIQKKDVSSSSSSSSPLCKEPKSDFHRLKAFNSTTSRVSYAKKASPPSFHQSSSTHHVVDTPKKEQGGALTLDKSDNDDSTRNNRDISSRPTASPTQVMLNTRRQMFEKRRQWAGTTVGLPTTAPKKEEDEETKPARARPVFGGVTQVDEEASTEAPAHVVGIEEGEEGGVVGAAPLTSAAKTTAGEVEESPILDQLLDAIRDAEIEMGMNQRINDGEEEPSSENKMEAKKSAVLPDVTSPSDVSPSACDDDDASKDEKDAVATSANCNADHDSVIPSYESKTESTKASSSITTELSTIKPSQMLNHKRKNKLLEMRRQSRGLISPAAQAVRLQPAFSGEVAAKDDDKEGEGNKPTSNAVVLRDKNAKPASANDDESKVQTANTAEESNESPLPNASSSSSSTQALDLYKRSKALANDAKKSRGALPREISMPSPRAKTTKKKSSTLYGDDGFPVDDTDVVGFVTLGRTDFVDTTSPMIMGDEKEEEDKRPSPLSAREETQSALPKEIASSSSSHPTTPKAENDFASFNDDDARLASSNNAADSGEDAFQPKEWTKSMSSPMTDDKVLAAFGGSSAFGDNDSGGGSPSASSAATTTDAFDQALESNVFGESAFGEEEDDAGAALYDCDAVESVGDDTDVTSSSDSRNESEAPSSAWSTARCDFGAPATSSSSEAANEIAVSIKLESFQNGLYEEQRAAFSEIIANHEDKARKLQERNRSKTAEVDFLKCEMTNQHEQILMLLDRAKKDKEDFAAKAAAAAEAMSPGQSAEVAELKRELKDLRAQLNASDAQDQEKGNKKSKKGKLNKVLRIKFPSSKQKHTYLD